MRSSEKKKNTKFQIGMTDDAVGGSLLPSSPGLRESVSSKAQGSSFTRRSRNDKQTSHDAKRQNIIEGFPWRFSDTPRQNLHLTTKLWTGNMV